MARRFKRRKLRRYVANRPKRYGRRTKGSYRRRGFAKFGAYGRSNKGFMSARKCYQQGLKRPQQAMKTIAKLMEKQNYLTAAITRGIQSRAIREKTRLNKLNDLGIDAAYIQGMIKEYTGDLGITVKYNPAAANAAAGCSQDD